MNKTPFSLAPEYRDYVWGGAKLRPGLVPTAEAWIIYAGNRVSSGPYAGRVLAELAEEFGTDLLGTRAVAQTGNRFPVLIKILDCAQWLSLQVHPNDEQAVKLEGEGFFGKTEAWHVLEAESDAKLIAGMKSNVTAEGLADSIKNGTILDTVQSLEVKAGDTLFMSPGTIHTLGPGLLIYEIQQTSDLTYRVYDWGRPETETRKLHIEKALAVSNPNATISVLHVPQVNDGNVKTLTQCKYFKLDTILAEKKIVDLDTLGESFHGLTVIEGQIQVSVEEEAFVLNKFETLLIPAICGAYQIKPLTKSRVLKASV
ncbi:MAG: class I mannose-6-phosphate isomerase [Anaerolineales bacterium]|nr:class I mannose-6-phosphate isomerase [Anaerolineales bacterium]